VRLPADCRFDGAEVQIRKDPVTGDVILSRRPDSWDSFFALARQAKIPRNFLANRRDEPPQDR
jgi:antitoxin VapB